MANEKPDYSAKVFEFPAAKPMDLKDGDGGGTYDGMEARVAVLEANAAHIREDLSEIRRDVREIRTDAKVEFRIIFGAIIAVALGLAALMAKGFHWL